MGRMEGVLTKMDKRGGRAADAAEAKARAALEQAGCLARTRLVRTSAKSRLGRDAMWGAMRRVVLADEEGEVEV